METTEVWNEEMARLAEQRRLLDAKLAAQVDAWRVETARLERREEELQMHQHDLVVRVRVSAGPAPTIYHIDPDTEGGEVCGRVTGRGRDIENFAQRFEGQVQSTLQRCSSCRWPVPKAGASNAA